MEFFKQLLAPDFMPHGFCYLWDPRIVWLHVISDGLIALSYYCIPVSYTHLDVYKRQAQRKRPNRLPAPSLFSAKADRKISAPSSTEGA